MEQIRKVFSIREIIIALCVGIAVIVLGGIFDLQFTQSVYDPVNTSMFGVILAGICELPVCLCLSFGGALMIKTRPNGKKWHEVLSMVIGIAALAVAAYFIYDTAKDWATFSNTQDFRLGSRIIGALLAFAIPGVIVWFVLAKLRIEDKRSAFILGIFLVAVAPMAALLSNIEKYLWSRPRPRYILGELNDPSLFHPLWKLDPLRALLVDKNGFDTNNLKSFPSGHTTYATTAIYFLPLMTLLSPKTKDNKMLQIILFYAGLAYAMVSGLSRVYAGAHWLSDTGAGLVTSTISGVVVYLIMTPIYNKITSKKEEVNNVA